MNLRTPGVGPVFLASATIRETLSRPCWPHERECNRPRIILCPRVRCAGLLVTLIVLGATPTALAAGCVGQPNSQTVQDGHWYYRQDPLNHRKCWFLQRQPPSTGSSTLESESTAAGAANLTSFLSSLFAIRKSAVSSGQQKEAAIAPTTPEPSADPVAPKKRSIPLHEHRGALNAKQAARLIEIIQVQLEHQDQQLQLDPAQREALFEEFLRWTVRQEQAPSFPGQ